MDIDARLNDAITAFWASRTEQKHSQIERGTVDAGTRGSVTGGTQMMVLEELVRDLLEEVGIDHAYVHTRKALELPGYFRSEKKWDLLVVVENRLLAAMEFKSQVGPSFGNNANNRAEEAIGSATDLWTAFREGRLGPGPKPFLGYFFLLEDCPGVHRPVASAEPHFSIDPQFKNATYAQRYELLLRRLVFERLYDAACLTLSTASAPPTISHPATELGFRAFSAALQGAAYAFVRGQG